MEDFVCSESESESLSFFPESTAEEDFSNFSVSMVEDTLHYQCLAAGRSSGEANATALWVKYRRRFRDKALSLPPRKDSKGPTVAQISE